MFSRFFNKPEFFFIFIIILTESHISALNVNVKCSEIRNRNKNDRRLTFAKAHSWLKGKCNYLPCLFTVFLFRVFFLFESSCVWRCKRERKSKPRNKKWFGLHPFVKKMFFDHNRCVISKSLTMEKFWNLKHWTESYSVPSAQLFKLWAI